MFFNAIQVNTDRTTVDPFRHPERTWPNLAIYVSAMIRSDPVRRLYHRFKRSLILQRWTRLDTQSALGKCMNLRPHYDPLRPCQTPIPSIQEISDRTTVDPFTH